ncbi:glycosyltransferase [Gammaproteobacteria bacterium]|nr:glycosyltransferase [Gammaproteobacteria bacterium]
MIHSRNEKDILKSWQGDKNKPIVSIVSASYNHEKYIAQAIDSFLMQKTSFPFEILIGEDCSTDSTRSILQKYQKDYPNIIKPVFWDKNVGPEMNWNTLVKKAKGEFIANCEGDDFWISDTKLEHQVREFRNNNKLSLIHTDVGHLVSWKSSHDRVRMDVHKSNGKTNIYGDMKFTSWFSCPIFSCTIMIKKTIMQEYQKSGVLECGMESGDRSIFLFAAQRGEIGYINQSTAMYRENIASLTNSDHRNFINFAIGAKKLMDFSLNYFDVNNLLRKECKKYSQKRVFNTIMKYGSIYDLSHSEIKNMITRRQYIILWSLKVLFFEKFYSGFIYLKRTIKVFFYYSPIKN